MTEMKSIMLKGRGGRDWSLQTPSAKLGWQRRELTIAITDLPAEANIDAVVTLANRTNFWEAIQGGRYTFDLAELGPGKIIKNDNSETKKND